MAFSIPQSEMLGLLLEGLAYGVYLYLFGQCLKIHLRKRNARGGFTTPWPVLLTTTTLFILINTRFMVDIARTYYAFTELSGLDAVNEYYGKDSSFPAIFRTGIFGAIIVVSDAFNVYRCFIVWDRRYIVCIAPFILLLADLAVSAVSTQYLRLETDNPGDLQFHTRTTSEFNYFCAVSLAANLLCTALIVYKLWSTGRYVSAFRSRENTFLMRVMKVIIESSAMYSVLLLVLLVSDLKSSGLLFTMMCFMPPCIGAIFSQVFVRMSQAPIPQADADADVYGGSSLGHTITIGRLPTRMPSASGLYDLRLVDITDDHDRSAKGGAASPYTAGQGEVGQFGGGEGWDDAS